jgi:tetratricopeptide (TPR) repeat protein
VRISILCLLLAAGPDAVTGAAPAYDDLLRGGRAALQANRFEEARKQLEEAVKVKPEGGEAWAALAQAYFKLNFAVSAKTAAGKAEAASRANAGVLPVLADYYFQAGEPVRAADCAERYAATLKGPAGAEALGQAAQYRLAAKQPKPAIALAQKALAMGDQAPLRALLARSYEADRQVGRAINEYNRAILLDPYEETYYFQLSQLLLDGQNYATAVQVLEAGRKIFDKSPELELALGAAYHGLKKYDDAGFCLLKTVTLAPQVPQAYTLLGGVLDHTVRWLPEITSVFASFAEAQPKQYLPQFLYGKALLLGGDSAGAETRLRRSIALEGGFWESHFQLGALLMKEHKLPEAVEALKKSAGLAPANPLPHEQLARAYDLMGKPLEAKGERELAAKAAGPAAGGTSRQPARGQMAAPGKK